MLYAKTKSDWHKNLKVGDRALWCQHRKPKLVKITKLVPNGTSGFVTFGMGAYGTIEDNGKGKAETQERYLGSIAWLFPPYLSAISDLVKTGLFSNGVLNCVDNKDYKAK